MTEEPLTEVYSLSSKNASGSVTHLNVYHDKDGQEFLFGYDTGCQDVTTLTMGKRNPDNSVTILNTYYEDEARELYSKITEGKPKLGGWVSAGLWRFK